MGLKILYLVCSGNNIWRAEDQDNSELWKKDPKTTCIIPIFLIGEVILTKEFKETMAKEIAALTETIVVDPKYPRYCSRGDCPFFYWDPVCSNQLCPPFNFRQEGPSCCFPYGCESSRRELKSSRRELIGGQRDSICLVIKPVH